MKVYSCVELFQSQKKGDIRIFKEPNEVNLHYYRGLHSEGKRLINGWFKRAWRTWENDNEEVFEPFIFVWIAFNGWAACVTDADKDADILDSLVADREMNANFDCFLTQLESIVSTSAKSFFDLLPIFDAKELNKAGKLLFDNEHNRRERVQHYFVEGATKFEPKCWKRHFDNGENVPLDWAHILKAIYKVRCNLFHGHKMAHSEMNRQIVSAAFLTLANFLFEGEYLEK